MDKQSRNVSVLLGTEAHGAVLDPVSSSSRSKNETTFEGELSWAVVDYKSAGVCVCVCVPGCRLEDSWEKFAVRSLSTVGPGTELGSSGLAASTFAC